MAVIHRTTLVPGKLELISGWLLAQDWYRGRAAGPRLTKAGGFRLDDPDGEVGIEFMIVLDSAGDRAGNGARTGNGAGAAAYLVPLTYRGRELPGAGSALIGTTEHGVLGKRWVYDGTRDPVLLAQTAELIRGRAQPQAQSETGTPDPTLRSRPLTAGADGPVDVTFIRILSPLAGDSPAGPGQVSGLWTVADGSSVRGVLITARPAPD